MMFFLVQVYVDDLVFGSRSKILVNEFVKLMTIEFKMSMFVELRFFLGLQVTQREDGYFVSQTKYAENLIKKFGLDGSKAKQIPMETSVKLISEGDGEAVEQTLYQSMIESLLYLTASSLALHIVSEYVPDFSRTPRKVI